MSAADTPLHEAVRYGDLEEVKVALRQGHDPNQIGLYQWSAVHEAANNGDYEILKLLLKYGGSPNQRDLLKGCTSLHYTAQQGHYDCLRLLVDAGGSFDVRNNDGLTALDVALDEECASLLRKQRDQRRLSSSSIQEAWSGSYSSGRSLDQSQGSGTGLEQTQGSGTGLEHHRRSLNREDSLLDRSSQITDESYGYDDISIISGSTDSGKPGSFNWGSDRVVKLKKDIALGSIQISCEYNSKASTLKVRVWSISDLLLPPADTSMISTIYVKGYLHPDKRKETKRKTEEVKVESPHDTKHKGQGDSQSTVFKPATFSFSRGLEYSGISREMVQEKMLNLDVCITQKYSWKSFCVASLSMPLKTAVRKLVKERFPLSPRLSSNLPENMKVYSAKDLNISRSYGSIPNLRFPSMRSLNSESSKAVSDSGLCLTSVDCEIPRTPSIEINLTPDQERAEAELQEALEQIAIMEKREAKTSLTIDQQKSDGSFSLADDTVHDLQDISIEVPQTVNIDNWLDSDDSDLETGKITRKEKVKGAKISSLKKLGLRRKKHGSNSSKSRMSLTSDGSEVSLDSPTSDLNIAENPSDLVPIDFEYDEPRIRTSSSSSSVNNVNVVAEVHCSNKTKLVLEDESPGVKSGNYQPEFVRTQSLQAQVVNSGYSPKTKAKSQNNNRNVSSNQTTEDQDTTSSQTEDSTLIIELEI